MCVICRLGMGWEQHEIVRDEPRLPPIYMDNVDFYRVCRFCGRVQIYCRASIFDWWSDVTEEELNQFIMSR